MPNAYSSRDGKPCAEQVPGGRRWGIEEFLSPSIMREIKESVEGESSVFEMTIHRHTCACARVLESGQAKPIPAPSFLQDKEIPHGQKKNKREDSSAHPLHKH